MISNLFKIAFRNLRRFKGYTLVNVFGLAVGLAACIVILLYVEDELSFDRHHEHADRVFRVTQELRDEGGGSTVHRVLIDPPIAPLIKRNYAEVEYAARLTPVSPFLSVGDRYVDSGSCYWADPDILEIIDLPLRVGNPTTALVEPFSIVLSASKASALFGEADPIGQTVTVGTDDLFTVTGVFDDATANTHLPIDVLGSLSTMNSWFGEFGWGSPNYATYLRLSDGASAKLLERKIASLLADQSAGEEAGRSTLHLQSLTDIHLHSHLVGELGPNGDIRYVYLLSLIAGLILVIACINFMNLSTARSERRSREVGVRKSLGAGRGELVAQFLGESILLVFISLAVSIILVEIVLPFFDEFVGKSLGLTTRFFGRHLVLLIGLGILVGLAAGSYPALFLSSFRPIAILKGSHTGGGARFRAILVVSQFIIAIVLLSSTAVVYRQLDYINGEGPGFNQDQILVLPTVWDLKEDFDPFRQQLLDNPDILEVAQTNPVPSGRLSFSVKGTSFHPGESQPSTGTVYPVFVDAHFVPTYGIDLVAGRNFDDEFASDSDTGFLLNESGAAVLGWIDPEAAVGTSLQIGGWRGSVLGVVGDFHLESLHQKIAPMVFYMDPRNFRMVSIRIRPGADLPALVDFLQDRWQQYEPNRPISYSFLDERFQAAYDADRNLGRVFGTFSLLAILITCLGLFGLVAYSVEQRTKEVGIRKVLGASSSGIVLLFSRSFVRLVCLAIVVATPVAYVAMHRWMGSFAYHTTLPWWIFGASGLAALLITIATVGFQVFRVADTNPIQSLRYE